MRHPRVYRPLVLAAWIALAPAAHAAVPASGKAQAAAALGAFEALVNRTRAAGTLPRLSDPEAAGIFARLWDGQAILGAPPYTATDVSTLLAISGAENAIFKTYLLFAPQPGTLPNTAVNTLAYQDEIAHAAAFILKVQAAMLTSLDDFVAKLPPDQLTPTRLGGLRQAHVGAAQFAASVIEMLRVPGLKPDNRGVLIDALVGTADPMSAETTRPDRAALVAQIGAAASGITADEAARLALYRSALERQDCTGLCALQ